MGRVNKNQRAGVRGKGMDEDSKTCLPKFNYSNGAGWKTRKGAKIGGKPADASFNIRHKKRG
jgi:hypothetical protein